MKTDSSFLFVESEREVHKVVVVFSSANARSFTYYKALCSRDDSDILFIRDPYLNSWYLRDSFGGFAGWEEVKGLLSEYLSRYDRSDVLFLGSSMGGYAALKAWLLYPGSHCIAVSPQTVLNPSLPHNISREHLSVSVGNDTSLKLSGVDTRQLILICGSADLVDLFYVFESGLKPEVFFPVRGGDHLLSASLNSVGFFNKVVDLFVGHSLNNVFDLLVLKKFARDTFFNSFHSLYMASRAVDFFHLQGQQNQCLRTLDSLLSGQTSPGALMMKGHILNSFGDLDRCVECFDLAKGPSISELEPMKQLGSIFLKRGMYHEAISRFQVALSARPKDYDCLVWIGEAYFKVGYVDEARRSFELARVTRPSHSRVISVISRLGLDL